MISAHEAQEDILAHTRTCGLEEVPLGDALNRFLASPVIAQISLPTFDNSAMDGFAVRSGDTREASLSKPVLLKVVCTIAAGDTWSLSEGSGEAFRIMTGAPLPEGADAVIPFEEAISQGGGCLISRPVIKGENVRQVGEDVRQGKKVLEGGEKVTSRTIALLAALGINRVSVFRKPQVKIVSTGNELIDPGKPLSSGKIYNSNGPALVAAVREIGIDNESSLPHTYIMVGDSEEDLKETLRENLDSDVLITVGGVSAGDYDLVPKVLESLGAKIIFHKVAIKPGKPLLFAKFERCLIFGLPGNPVSAPMVFDRFVRPALLKMMGAKNPTRFRRFAIAEEELQGSRGKEDCLRGIVEYREGNYFARSAGPQGSAHLLPLARANAILIIPPEKESIQPLEPLEVEILSEGT